MNTTDQLPRWDVSVVYPSLESAEFEAGFSDLITEIDEMTQLFDELQVEGLESAAVDSQTVQNVETVLGKMGQVEESLTTVYAYIHSFVTTNSRNELAQAKRSD